MDRIIVKNSPRKEYKGEKLKYIYVNDESIGWVWMSNNEGVWCASSDETLQKSYEDVNLAIYDVLQKYYDEKR